MANPAKRRESGSGSGRVTPKGTRPGGGGGSPQAGSARYTPPQSHVEDMPSPIWVPILMFTLLGLGLLMIFLNYAQVLLPGVADGSSGWYLLGGLGLILGGIITATQYR